MTKYLSALFAVAFAFAVHAAAPTGPITLEAKNGNVTFEHSKHSQLKCETCHASAAGGKIEGFGKEKAEGSDLESTYRVMRAFHMLKERPDAERCRAFVAKCRNADGGYGVAPGQASAAGPTYYAASILGWLGEK